MRSLGLMAILLLFVACKPVARGPVSDLEAVSDGNLTLGMVPVESSNGMQAYRLLVCRKSASYPKWMLEDNNRCRSALLDPVGNEVVFLHDELERDFATKYTGYGKGFVVPALIGVGATAALFGIGAKGLLFRGGEGGVIRWANRGIVQTVTRPVTDAWGKITSWPGFENKVFKGIVGAPASTGRLGQKGLSFFPNFLAVPLARFRLLQLESVTGKWAKVYQLDIQVVGAMKEQSNILDAAHNLHKLREEKSLLEGLKKADDKAAYLQSLQKNVDELGKDNFVKVTDGMKLPELPKKGTPEFDDITLADINPSEYFEKVGKMNQIKAREELIAKGASFDPSARITELTAKAGSDGAVPDNSIAKATRELRKLKSEREYTPFGVSYAALRDFAIKGAAGIALVTMTDLDKSVWGYAERQTSVHWSQVFSEGMQSENKVKDLPTLLSGFAEFFGHRVNPSALALGN